MSPRFSAMFAFQMLGSTPQGEAYTAREFDDVGRAAGFSAPSEAVAADSAEPHPVRAGVKRLGEQVSVSFWYLADARQCAAHVRSWHKADISRHRSNLVAIGGIADIGPHWC